MWRLNYRHSVVFRGGRAEWWGKASWWNTWTGFRMNFLLWKSKAPPKCTGRMGRGLKVLVRINSLTRIISVKSFLWMWFDFKLEDIYAHHKHEDMNPWGNFQKGILQQEEYFHFLRLSIPQTHKKNLEKCPIRLKKIAVYFKYLHFTNYHFYCNIQIVMAYCFQCLKGVFSLHPQQFHKVLVIILPYYTYEDAESQKDCAWPKVTQH